MDRHHDASGAVAALGAVGVIIIVLIVLALFAFGIWMQWRILVKAGFNGALSLLLLLGGIGFFIVQIILAFTTWPRDRVALPPNAGYGGPPANV